MQQTTGNTALWVLKYEELSEYTTEYYGLGLMRSYCLLLMMQMVNITLPAGKDNDEVQSWYLDEYFIYARFDNPSWPISQFKGFYIRTIMRFSLKMFIIPSRKLCLLWVYCFHVSLSIRNVCL